MSAEILAYLCLDFVFALRRHRKRRASEDSGKKNERAAQHGATLSPDQTGKIALLCCSCI
jgi:hypothetical protein